MHIQRDDAHNQQNTILLIQLHVSQQIKILNANAPFSTSSVSLTRPHSKQCYGRQAGKFQLKLKVKVQVPKVP